jgi:hypothetical protein
MILQELAQINKDRETIVAVAYEEFNLGPSCTLVKNDFTAVGQMLTSWGIETYPMISSFPYPPDFLDWMRACFESPDTFLKHAVKVAVEEGFTGYNVDWEPTGSATAADATAYAKFMDKFAKAMHAAGKKLTMAVATWNPIWNLQLLGQTDVDKIMTMSTYTSNFTTFHTKLNQAASLVPIHKLGIGLQDDTNPRISDLEAKLRVQMIQDLGIQEIDIWQAPIPDGWMLPLRRFAANA